MSAPPGIPNRLRELDAIRGLAAVAVLLGHSAVVFPAFDDPSRADGPTVLNLAPSPGPSAGWRIS